MTFLERDHSVTMTKGVGILLMVMGHSGCPMPVLKFIYMFHVPLFFLMSGYCFKEKYLSDGMTFLWRRIIGLYWPFVKWGTFFIVLHNLLCYIHVNPISAVWGEHFYNGVCGNIIKMVTRITCHEPMLGGYWFLRELFLGSVFAYTVIRLMGRLRKYAWVPLLFMTIVLREYDYVYFPRHIAISFLSFYAATFVAFGYAIKDYIGKLRYSWIVIALSFIITLFSSIVYPHHEVFSQTSGSISPYMLTASCGTLMILCLCEKLSCQCSIVRDFLIFCGNHSLSILTWHFLCFKLVSLMIVAIYDLPIERLSEHPVIYISYTSWWVIYFIIGSFFPLTIIRTMSILRTKTNHCF